MTTLTRAVFASLIGICSVLVSQPHCLGQGPGSLPFASTYRRPSTSRYQNIANFAINPLAAGNVYQSLVKPALEMDRNRIEQISQSRQLGDLQNSVRQLERQPARVMDQTIRPTGHSATFLNYSHFYPSGR